MTLRRLGGIVLVLSAVAALLSGLTVSRTRTVAEVGPVQLNVHEDRRPMLPRWVAGVMFVAGVGLVVAGHRRSRSA